MRPCPALVLCALQIKIKKADNDLLVEQLREVFRVLAADKVAVSKLEKRLDDVTHRWDEVKKLQPQVKGNVEPVQVGWLQALLLAGMCRPQNRHGPGCAGGLSLKPSQPESSGCDSSPD